MLKTLVLLLLAAVACRQPDASAIAYEGDAIVSNGPATIPVPAWAVSASGESLAVRLAMSVDSTEIAEVVDDGVRCLKAGDVTVTLAFGRIQQRIELMCRPVVSFAPPIYEDDLFVGGPPVPLAVIALDAAGKQVHELTFSARNSDTTVIHVVDGMVYPRALGTARVIMDFGGVSTDLSYEVAESVARDSLQLAAREVRIWRLGPGKYRSRFFSESSEGGDPVSWRAPSDLCAYASDRRSELHCAFRDSASIAIFARRGARVFVRIDRRSW